MAKPTKVTLKKKPKGTLKAKVRALKPQEQVSSFEFEFDEDVTNCTVYGVAQDGSQVDISGVATLQVSSSDTSICTVDPPVGMTFTMHGVAAGNAVVSATATWNDGSIGPFSFDLPVTVTSGPTTGIVVVPGTPTPRP